MILSAYAVDNWLKRPVKDSEKAKLFDDAALDAKLAALKPRPRFTTAPKTRQKVCFLLCANYPGYYLTLDMGMGKALSIKESVLTPLGFVQAWAIRVGDLVIGKNGRPTKVLGVYPQGKKQTFEVGFSDGSKVVCTDDHLWAVQSPVQKKRGDGFQVKTLGEIRQRLRTPCGNARYYVPIVEAVEFAQVDKLPLDPYVLGVLLGDGALGGTGCSVTLGPSKQGVLEAIRRRGVEIGSRNRITYGVLGIRHILRDLRVNVKSKRKHIPDSYLCATILQRLRLLQGLLDTDGECGTSVLYHSASWAMIEGVKFLVQSLGGVAKVGRSRVIDGWSYYRLSINLPEQFCPFYANEGKVALFLGRKRKYFPTRAVTSVTPAGDQECVCFRVEAEDGLFVTRDFVVTHNTHVALNVAKWRISRGDTKSCLVLVPFGTNVAEWVEQAKLHTPKLKIVPLDLGHEGNRKEIEEGNADIVVSTTVGFLYLMSDKIPCSKMDKETGVLKTWNELRVNDVKCWQAAERFRMIVLDEIMVGFRNDDTTFFHMISQMRRVAPYCYGLSGTPYNKPEDLWSQFFLIDGGETLGATKQQFLSAFFTQTLKKIGKRRFYERKFRTDRADILHRMLKHRSIRYSEDEADDYPPVTGGVFCGDKPYVVRVPFSPETWAYYEKLVTDLKKAEGNFTLVENAWIRMRQILAGYIGVIDPEGETITIRFKNNPKMKALIEFVKSVHPSRKIIVYCVLRATGSLLQDELRRAGIRTVRIRGGMRPSERKRVLHQFRNGRAQILVSSEAAAYGINLQAASVEAFYETPTPPIVRRQMERRAARPGRSGRVWIADFVVVNSKDEDILTSLMKDEDLFQKIIEGGKKKRKRRLRLGEKAKEEE